MRAEATAVEIWAKERCRCRPKGPPSAPPCYLALEGERLPAVVCESFSARVEPTGGKRHLHRSSAPGCSCRQVARGRRLGTPAGSCTDQRHGHPPGRWRWADRRLRRARAHPATRPSIRFAQP